MKYGGKVRASLGIIFNQPLSLFVNVNSFIVCQDDQKMKNTQNEEYYLGDDADEDSREGKTLLSF